MPAKLLPPPRPPPADRPVARCNAAARLSFLRRLHQEAQNCPQGQARGHPVRGRHRPRHTRLANRPDQLHRPIAAQGRQPPPGDARRLWQAHHRGRARTPPRRWPARSRWASICDKSAPRRRRKRKRKPTAEEAKKFTVAGDDRSVAAQASQRPTPRIRDARLPQCRADLRDSCSTCRPSRDPRRREEGAAEAPASRRRSRRSGRGNRRWAGRRGPQRRRLPEGRLSAGPSTPRSF